MRKIVLIVLLFCVGKANTQGCWRMVSAGNEHTAAIKTDGTLWTWGDNTYGQIGDGTNYSRNIPVQIGITNNWKSVAAGQGYTIALKTDGTLWAWGDNTYGQLGDGTNTGKNIPLQISTATNWESLTTKGRHTVGLKTDGTLWTWGDNHYGQLGDGTFINKNSPIQVDTATNWAFINAGGLHTVALKKDSTLWAWGINTKGQLGDGTNILKTTPVQIGTSNKWLSASAGVNHTLALKVDSTLWAWGYNASGELGDGTTIDKITPIQINIINNCTKINAGLSSTLILRDDSTLWGWGYNYYGQLGDGTNVNKILPVQIGNAINWISVVMGDRHTLALKSDGTLWAWGDNNRGQLGDSSTKRRLSPIKIICPVTCFNVSGNLQHPAKIKINNVWLNVTGINNSYSKMVSGFYTDSCTNINNNTLRPTKNNDITKANGVTATDVLFVQRHILGTAKLNNAYKIIAADVDGNKQINATDVLRIKRLILGTDTTFKNTTTNENRLWAFVDSAYQFADTTNPFPFKDSISYTNLTSNKTNQTFIGIKLGDVNFDWNAAVAKGKPVNSLELIVNSEVDKQKNITTKLQTPNNVLIAALQATLHFDNTRYEFVNLEGFKNLQGLSFNASQANETGNIAILWTDKNAEAKMFNAGDELFEIILRPKQSGMSNQKLEISVNDEIAKSLAIDESMNERKIILKQRVTKNEQPVTINKFSIFPNPAKGNVTIETIGVKEIDVIDHLGRTINKQSINIQSSILNIKLTKGVYIVKAVMNDGTVKNEKLIVE